MALLNHESRRDRNRRNRESGNRRGTCISTAFVDAMAIPHKHAPSSHLQKPLAFLKPKTLKETVILLKIETLQGGA